MHDTVENASQKFKIAVKHGKGFSPSNYL